MRTGLLQRLLKPNIVNQRAYGGSSIFPFAFGATRSGVQVTQGTALSASAVWACVRVLAESVAQLPLFLYERSDAGKRKAAEHPIYQLLHDLPNPEMTSFQLRRMMMVHIATWGNAYCEIEWGDDGYPVALWPLMPNVTEPVRVGGSIYYDTRTPDGATLRLPAYRVWHVTGLGTDPMVGISPIRQHMETIGLAQAMTAHGAAFFANGARPGIVLKHQGKLNDEALKRLKTSVTEAYEGIGNAYRTMILEEGMGIETVGIPPDEAQFLGSREFQTVEIARIYNVPPHMIQHLADATYSNIEHQGLQFVTNTLMPYLVNFEQTIKRDLLVGGERNGYFAEFLVDGLQRSDIATRYQAYSTGIQNGILSINEARARENLDQIEGGDVHLVPLNLIPLGQQPAQSSQERSIEACTCGSSHNVRSQPVEGAVRADDGFEAQRKRRVSTAKALMPVFEDAFGRAVRREGKAVSRAAARLLGQRNAEEFDAWLDKFYEEFLPTLQRDLTPGMLSVARQAAEAVADELGGDAQAIDDATRTFVDEFLQALGIEHILSSKTRVRQLMADAVVAEEDVVAVIEAGVTDWETNRANQSADLTAFEALNALIVFNYKRRGVRRIMWQAACASCRFCQSLSGQTIDIESFFVEEGAELDMGDAGRMAINRSKRHAPLHAYCDCQVRAVIEAA